MITIRWDAMITAQGRLDLPLEHSLTNEELAHFEEQVEHTIYRVLTRRLDKLSGVKVTGVTVMNLREDENT